MDVTDTASTKNPLANGQSGQSGGSDAARAATDFETFLTLLTTQLQNQDPLAPMESTQFVAQLANFSAVEQQVKTNDLLEGLVSTLGGESATALASWIGNAVPTDAPVLFDGAPVDILAVAASDADGADVRVINEAGQTVRRMSLTDASAVLTWDGTDDAGNPAPIGTYSFLVDSFQGGQRIDRQPATTYATVIEARRDPGGGTSLLLENGATLDASAVISIRDGGR